MRAGDAIRTEFTKFGGSPHWGADGIFLGDDQFGSWLFYPRGTVIAKPGSSFEAVADHVQFVHPDLPSVASIFSAKNAHPEMRFDLYVDMTTTPRWNGNTVRMIDLDLDVIRHLDGRVEVVDEDEFAGHQIRYGYPDDIVDLARRSRDDVFAAITSQSEPYRTVAHHWLQAAQVLMSNQVASRGMRRRRS